MGNLSTIAIELAVDNRRVAPGLMSVVRSVEEADRTFMRLDDRTRRLGGSVGEFSGGALRTVPGSSNAAARGILELSRGVEDAAVSFGVNGIQGAIRGSLNNMSQFAMITGGPAAGAIAGFAAAGVSVLAPFVLKMFEVRDAAKEMADAIETRVAGAGKALEKSFNGSERAAGFWQEIRGVDSSSDATAAMQKRRSEIEAIDFKRSDIEQARDKNWKDSQNLNGMSAEAFKAKREAAARIDHELSVKANELLRERVRLEGEIAEIKGRLPGLSAKDNFDEMHRVYEQFLQLKLQKEDADAKKAVQEQQRATEEDRKDKNKDAKSGLSFLQREMRQLSPTLFKDAQREMQLRDIGAMNLPEDVRKRLADAIGQDSPKSFASFASSAQEGSAAAARAIFSAREQDRSVQAAEKQFQKLGELQKVLEQIRDKNAAPEGTVNLT